MNVNVARHHVAGTISCSPVVTEMQQSFPAPDSLFSSQVPGLGYCLLQAKKGNPHLLQSTNISVQHTDGKLEISTDSGAFILMVSLQSQFSCDVPDVGDRLFCEQACNLLYMPSGTVRLNCNSPLQGSLIVLHYPENLVLQFPSQYPLLQVLLQKINLRQVCWLHRSNRTVSRSMVEQLEGLQYKTYQPELFSLYLRAKATELLLAVLDEFSQDPDEGSRNIKLSKWDTEQLYTLKRWLTENSDEPGTMEEIAHRTGLNTFKLKRGFRQLFGVSIFSFVLRIRMKRALVLLKQSNESVSSIGMILGYKNLFSFIRAFKKYYGCSPAVYRKEQD
ncbi:MAG: AraC family transcriptional regulator [Chitinophagaceae bacterium]